MDAKCVLCGTKLIVRNGRYGEFLACPKSTPNSPHPTVSIFINDKRYWADWDYEDDANQGDFFGIGPWGE